MGEGFSVLIVEDEAIAAMDAAARLHEMGMQVLGPATSAEQALALCEAHPVDLALMDVRLRGPMDGIAAAATMRARWDTPVIFVTAYSDPDTLTRIAEVEPYGYLLKPIDEAALRVTVHTALRRRELERARARAEQERERTAARYREILDHSHDGIVSIDAAQRIIVFNRGAETIFGWPAKAAIGASLDALIPGALGARHREFVDAILEGSVISRPMTLREVQGLRRDGTTFPAEVSISRLELDGQVLVTAVVRDLSERRRLEARYHHAQKLDTIGRLTSSIAHDFNNQLVPIGGYADLLCKALPADDARHRDAQQIRAAAARAAQLTRQLLTFARRDLLQPIPVSPDALLADLSGVLARLAGGDVSVEMDLHAGATLVQLNPSYLEQVILNLVVNARDAMEGGGQLRLRTECVSAGEVPDLHAQPDAGTFLVLRVSDTGPGIESVVLAQIFEPFFTTKAAGIGTGLGLATVREIVERADGTIHVESTPGAGATFSVYLPTCVARVPSVVPAKPSQHRQRLTGGTRVTALVVDDDEDVRRFAGRVLSDAGYEVTLARTARQARALCPQPLHLLVTDLSMPGDSGVTLGEQLARETDCDVLYMSGLDDPDLARRGLLPRGARVLHKPFTADELEEAAGTRDRGSDPGVASGR